MFITGQSQHVAGPAIITVVLQAACCETDPGSQPAGCHLAPNKVSHVLPWDFQETGLRNYFQGDFLFLRLILAVWAQYQMLGYYVFNMIWIPLGQESCNVCICHGRAQLGFARQFVKPWRKKQFVLAQRDLELIPEHRKHWLHYLLLPMRGVWVGDAEQCLWALLPALGWTFTSPGDKVTGDWDDTWTEQGQSYALPGITGWAVPGEGGSSPCLCLLDHISPDPQSPHVTGMQSVTAESQKSTFPLCALCPRAGHAPAASCCWNTFSMKGCSNVHLDLCLCYRVIWRLSKGKCKSSIYLHCQVWYRLRSNEAQIKADHIHWTECWLTSIFLMLVQYHHFSVRDNNASFGSLKCNVIIFIFPLFFLLISLLLHVTSEKILWICHWCLFLPTVVMM